MKDSDVDYLVKMILEYNDLLYALDEPHQYTDKEKHDKFMKLKDYGYRKVIADNNHLATINTFKARIDKLFKDYDR
jgi:hypothetical protein